MLRLSRASLRSVVRPHRFKQLTRDYTTPSFKLKTISADRMTLLKKALGGQGQIISINNNEWFPRIDILTETEFKSTGFSVDMDPLELEHNTIQNYFPRLRKFIECVDPNQYDRVEETLKKWRVTYAYKLSEKKKDDVSPLESELKMARVEKEIIYGFNEAMVNIKDSIYSLAISSRDFYDLIELASGGTSWGQRYPELAIKDKSKEAIKNQLIHINKVCSLVNDMLDQTRRAQYKFFESIDKMDKFNKHFVPHLNRDKIVANYTSVFNMTNIDVSDTKMKVMDDLDKIKEFLGIVTYPTGNLNDQQETDVVDLFKKWRKWVDVCAVVKRG